MGGSHFDDALIQFDDGDVESPATQVVDRHQLAVLHPVEPIGQGGRRGFVDDALHLEAGQFARLVGRQARRVREEGRDRDDGPVHRLPQGLLGDALHLLEYQGRELRGRPGAAIQSHGLVRAHLAFDGLDGKLRVHQRLIAGRRAHQQFALGRKADDGRDDPLRPFG